MLVFSGLWMQVLGCDASPPTETRGPDAARPIDPDSSVVSSEAAERRAEREAEDEAIAIHRRVLENDPENVGQLRALAQLLKKREDKTEVIVAWRALLELEPCSSERDLLAGELRAQGRYREQVEALEIGIDECPRLPAMLNNLAWALATSPDAEVRDGARALATIERAMELRGKKKAGPVYMDTKAAALAELGRFEDAARVQKRAIRNLRLAKVDESIVADFEQRLAIYEQGMPLRDP